MKQRSWWPFISLLSLPFLIIILTHSGFAQDSNRAAVVVRFGENQVESRCVAFEEMEISGFELIQRSGLALEQSASGMGSLLCGIEGAGCPADDCLCQCRGGDSCVYWSYWQQQSGQWNYARVGASNTRVSNGDVDGWSWGPGTVADAIEPPPVTYEAICDSDQPINQPPEVDAVPAINWRSITAFVLIMFGLGLIALAIIRQRSKR